MPIQDLGVTCDVSALTDRDTLDRTQDFFNSSGLYIPNSTYSWLKRSKFIEVRKQAVKYSLISELVRNRRIFPTHLPGIYDEISRKIMFETEHNVALTDLRGLLLSTHLQLPILTFDKELVKRISKEIGVHRIHEIETTTDWLSISKVLELYRDISFDSGKQFFGEIENNTPFPKVTRKIQDSYDGEFTKIKSSDEPTKNPAKTLKFTFLIWNIFPFIQEYHSQKIIQSETARQICERCVLLVAQDHSEGKRRERDVPKISTSTNSIKEKQKG